MREATEKEVVNVARYYHHETVRVGGEDDGVCNCMQRAGRYEGDELRCEIVEHISKYLWSVYYSTKGPEHSRAEEVV